MLRERSITPRLLTALGDTPAVMLVGPRQAGKSTLVKELASGPHPARYLSLEICARSRPHGAIPSD